MHDTYINLPLEQSLVIQIGNISFLVDIRNNDVERFLRYLDNTFQCLLIDLAVGYWICHVLIGLSSKANKFPRFL